jgi:predicted phosphodiesterase
MKKLVAGLVVAAVVAAGGALAAYWLLVSPSTSIQITGGVVTYESEELLTIWCYQPQVELTLEGCGRTVELHNCIHGSEVAGVSDAIFKDNTTISFHAPVERTMVRVSPPVKSGFTFAVMGDSQGHNDVLARILERLDGCEFAFICGDLTPSGRPSEFVPFQDALNASSVPVYTTVGNHDVKTDGPGEYISRFGPTEYSFEYAGVTFTVVDSSDLNITSQQIEWMRGEFEGANKKVVLTHAPCYDPFGDNHTLFPESCDRMLDFASSNEIDVVFSGHVHAFNYTTMEDTEFVITGGAGGTLVDGEHHYVNVTIDASLDTSFEKHDVVVDLPAQPFITVTGKDGSARNLTYEDLAAMNLVSGYSSFENNLGNIGGEGDYSGVSIADLVDLAGGMQEGDVLRVVATDGYPQDFGYLNVYPDETWLDLQGIMVLALTYGDESVPTWEDGPKLVMIPGDGLYDNTDCEATSYEGQGYWEYPSAGARWVKNVASIQVIAQ